jgi:hypothetical protein
MSFLDSYFGGKFPTLLSLLIVVALILGSIVFSLLKPAKEQSSKDLE